MPVKTDSKFVSTNVAYLSGYRARCQSVREESFRAMLVKETILRYSLHERAIYICGDLYT
jgi:hypothetical protein